jgi:hypothetical protein
MTIILMQSGPFAARFGHRFGFAHHRKAWRRRSDPAFGPSWRFSTWFGRLSRCANLPQNAGHHATHLSRGDRTRFAFPRAQRRLAEVLSHQQLIASTGHDPTPTLDLLRRAQVGLGPEQVLLEKAIAMLEAQNRFRYQGRTCSNAIASWPVQTNQLSRGSRLVSRAASLSTRMTITST